jgi:putative DNA primase/helicase
MDGMTHSQFSAETSNAAVIRERIADAVRLHLDGQFIEAAQTLKDVAKRHGVKPSVVNAEFKALLQREQVSIADAEASDAVKQGRPLSFDEPTPAANPKPLADVLDTVARVFRKRVVCSPEALDAAALWTAATWGCRPPGEGAGPEIMPRLLFTSATKRCGKSTALDTVKAMVPRPLSTEGITEAALFRTTALYFPTLCLDEGDTYMRNNEPLRALLNSGFARGGQVLRVVEVSDGQGGRAQVPHSFPTFCPVVLAGIGNMPSTVEDRAIRVRLERKPPGRQGERIRGADLARMRTKITPHLAAHSDVLAAAMAAGVANSRFPPGLGDRDADNWEPLLAVADLAGGEWPQRATAAALKLCGDGEDRRDRTEMLLADISEFTREQRQQRWDAYRSWRAKGRAAGQLRPRPYDFIPTSELLSWLVSRDTSPWGECNHGRPLSAHGLNRMLKALKIASGRDRRGGRITREEVRGFWLPDFRAVWRRYL